jgi:transcriptional regulator with XRE-family HTH domain
MGFSKEEKVDYQEKAWELRLRGMSQSQIAEVLGVTQPYVCILLKKALEDKKEELVGTAEKHVANQAGRLDKMLDALWEKVQAGDPKAIAAALAIEDRRSKLLGLDVAQRKALDITTGGESVSFKIEIPIVDRIRGAEGEDG